MILWTRAKLEDFIRLIDFRRAFLNFFLAIIMGARYICLCAADGVTKRGGYYGSDLRWLKCPS
jgi:hypothetical protein